MHYGDIRLNDTLDLKFTTRRFTTGAPFTLAGTPVVSAYVGNGTTEITAGVTLTVDFDGRTGLNHVRVVATAGNGFATATNVQLVITTGTVDGVSVVGEVVGTFSIEARSALMPTTAARTLLVDAVGNADARLADAVAHGGTLGASTATLALSRINTTSQTLNTSAITAIGNGTGHGIAAASGAGATGNGINAAASSTAGNGIAATGTTTGSGINASSAGGNGHGMRLLGAGTGQGLSVSGGAGNAAGATFGGSGTGAGISVAAGGGNANGIESFGNGTGDGMHLQGGGGVSGNGLHCQAGASGAGIYAEGIGVDRYGIEAAGTGATHSGGMKCYAVTDGEGFEATAVGANRIGMQIQGGSGVGDGLKCVAGGTGVPIRGDLTGNITGNLSGSVGSVTGNVGGNVVGSVGSVAAGGITAASIATNAIDADAIAADAVTEIQAGLATSAAVAGVQADTDNIQTRLPAALVGGRMDSSVGAMATDVLTAAALAADAVTEIQAGLATTAQLVSEINSVQADIAALNNLSAAQVNAEVVDALSVDLYAEPTGVPPATDTLANKIGRVHQALRNKIVVDSGTGKKQFFDDNSAALWEKDLTDAAGVYTETEGNAP